MIGIEESQKRLYEKKFAEFGDDPRSLSWSDRDGQYLRFSRLAELFRYEHDAEKYPECDFYVQSIVDDIGSIPPRMKGKDYYCLSGTFHTKENNPVEAWESFIFKGMENMFGMAKKGICVNFLTSQSDFYNDRLYYADPMQVMDFVLSHLSRFVSISHDLPLFEFFVYVYKEGFIRSQFSGYKKYFGGRR